MYIYIYIVIIEICVYLRVHSVKVSNLPWAQAPPCLRTERKARHTALGRVERILCGVVADGSGFGPRMPFSWVAAA